MSLCSISTSEANAMATITALGITPDWFVGSLGEAVAAVKDNRSVGYCKSGPGIYPDATALDVMTLIPMRTLSFTDEHLKILKDKVPYLGYGTVPADMAYQGAPAYNVFNWGISISTSKDMPEEIVYKMTKAVCEHPEPQKEARSEFPADDPAGAIITQNMWYSPPPLLHAGTVRYLMEIGLEVPEALIPPEFKK